MTTHRLPPLIAAIFIGTLLTLGLLLLSQGDVRSAAAPDPIPHVSAAPPAPGQSACAYDQSELCIGVYTGTVRAAFNISNPDGISGFSPYHLANFDQRVIRQSDTSIDVEVEIRLYVDTHAAFPVDAGSLPEDARNNLQPQANWVQSDDPEILAQAAALVADATTQAEAVDAIVAWVRANITYDYTFSLPNDASAVFRNRSGVCAGFSSLTTALLRAAGIPARVQTGCVAPYGGWQTDEQGGWHAWIEAYYPDVGWIASDPQVTINFIDTAHLVGGFDQCSRSGTVIDRTSHRDSSDALYYLRTPYTDTAWPSLQAAAILAWDRHPLNIVPTMVSAMLPISRPVGTLSLHVENLSCYEEGWQVRSSAAWLTPPVVTGETAGVAQFTINATGVPTGTYATALHVYETDNSWDWEWHTPHVVTATLILVDHIDRVYLPVTARQIQ